MFRKILERNVSDAYALESALHKLFKSDRVKLKGSGGTEWFELSKSQIEMAKKIIKKQETKSYPSWHVLIWVTIMGAAIYLMVFA